MKRQPKQEDKKVYLYARLSHEDAQLGDSESIQNQRKLLIKYAEDNNLTPYVFVYDDGYSGADGNRPEFRKMIEDVEAGNVRAVVVKDRSRFYRDRLQIGFFEEVMFPKYDVRFIAIHDNTDTDKGDNDLAPIVDLFNEWFVKSTSKKIRAVWQSKGRSGERLAVIPIYGYRKPAGEKHALEIDEESATVVRRIFKMCTEGKNAAEIAKTLMSEHLLNPSAYKYERGIMAKQRPMKDPYLWNTTVIHKILDAPEYLGTTVNFKTWTKSYKDKKVRTTPEEQRLVFENTHPAIIDEQTWSIVRKMRETKRRAPRYGEVGLFTGICRCADCGAKLYYQTREIWNKAHTVSRHEGAYSCSEYRKDTQFQTPRKCSCHYIREDALADVVLIHLRLLLQLTIDEEAFAKRIMELSEVEQTKEIAANKKLIAAKKRRVIELDNLFDSSYEDKTRKVISEELFLRMSAKFGQEQAALRVEIETLEATVGEREGQLGDINKFLARAREIRDLKALTPAIVNALIDKIVVYEPDKKRGKDRQQRIEIVYRFVGPFDAIDEQERQAGQTQGRQELAGRDTQEPQDHGRGNEVLPPLVKSA